MIFFVRIDSIYIIITNGLSLYNVKYNRENSSHLQCICDRWVELNLANQLQILRLITIKRLSYLH